MNLNIPSPLDKVFIPQLSRDIYIKRDDLIHEIISGNKWRKLKYFLAAFDSSKYIRIVSIGGAYSNHLHALSYTCYLLNIPCKLYIYGSQISNDNKMIQDVMTWNSEIQLITRSQKTELIVQLQQLNDIYFIPEGGEGELAEKGVAELLNEMEPFVDSAESLIILPYGTGTSCKALLKNTINAHILTLSPVINNQILLHKRLIQLPSKYNLSFAGYCTEYYNEIALFKAQTNILLDPIYSAKLMLSFIYNFEKYKIYKDIYFIHTGGLQSWRNYNLRYKLEPIS
jgi:1-aminocyclopropane-1-carboxylate deaminase